MTEDYKRGISGSAKRNRTVFENRDWELTDAFLFGAVRMATAMIKKSFIKDCKILEEQGGRR